MDQAVIVGAITDHLDAIESSTNATIVLALVVAWAGIQRSRQVEVLGTKIDRRYAFGVISAIYLLANGAVLILFLRVGDLLRRLDTDHAREGVSRLITHSWILNPFAHFADAGPSRVLQSGAIGVLVVFWWLCTTSLWILLSDKRNRRALIFLATFAALGLGSLVAINRATIAAIEILGGVDVRAATELGRGLAIDWRVGILGVGIGVLLFLAAIRWQGRVRSSGAL
jgi:hypothetical protein